MELFRNGLKMTASCNEISYSGLCADDCVNLYNKTLINLINQHCPLFEKTFQLDCSRPQWFKSNLRQLKRKKENWKELLRNILVKKIGRFFSKCEICTILS